MLYIIIDYIIYNIMLYVKTYTLWKLKETKTDRLLFEYKAYL